MLDLRSQRWEQLQHAYGAAADIPLLLEQLRTTPPSRRGDWEAEPWFSLWSSLCHQNDVYTASYAAIPHIVGIAATKPVRERVEFVHFVAWVEICRHGSTAPVIPGDLESAYFGALQRAVSVVLECLDRDWSEEEYRVLLGGLAVLQGQPQLGAAIIDPSEELECPACGMLFPAPGHWLFEKGESESG